MSAVLIDHERRTALVVSQGRKLTHLVTLEEGELVVRTFTQAQLRDRAFRELEYPVRKAVRIYLQHAGGVSPKARRALQALRRAA